MRRTRLITRAGRCPEQEERYEKTTLSILTCLALYLTLFPASGLAEEMEVPENVPVEEVPNETAGAEPAGDSGPTYTAAEVPGFTVFLAEPSFPSISLMGVLNSGNSWIDTGTFTNGVYEGVLCPAG